MFVYCKVTVTCHEKHLYTEKGAHESQLQNPCRRRLAIHQQRELQVMALSTLSVLVPYQPELFLRQEGARCVLSLIVHELDEAVRSLNCLSFTRI